MPVGNWNVNWLNLNGQRRYPLAADATARDATGTFELPDDFIVELDLATHYGVDVDPARFFLLHLGVYQTGFSVVIGYQPVAGAAVKVATALVSRDAHERNTVYSLGGVAPFADCLGKITIGVLDSIDLQPPGFWTFSYAGGRLEADAVRPVLRGVSSIRVVNGEQRSEPIYGDVELTAGTNIQLVPSIVNGQAQIRIDAIDGAGTVEACVCEGTAEPGPPIRTIGGVGPTPGGDFAIIGSDCLKITPVDNGLRIEDTCAKPCCGCTELEKITRDYEKLTQQVALVEDLGRRLQNSVDSMAISLAASDLSPCPTA